MRERFHRIFPWAMMLALGLLASTGFSFAGAYFWTAVAFAGALMLLTNASSAKQAAQLGFCFGLTYFAFGLRWVLPAMNVHGGLPLPMALFGLLALAVYQALFPAAAAFVGAKVPGSKTAKCAWILPLTWVLFEFLRGEWICSFGWMTVGYAFTGNILSAYAPLVGAYGVSLVVLLIAGAVAAILCREGAQTERLLAGLLCGALVLGGYGLESVNWSKPGAHLQVRLVQPDLPVTISPSLKRQQQAIERVRAMSLTSPLGRSLDCILWPESVYQFVLTRLPKACADAPRSVATAQHCDLLFNAFSEPQRREYFNSVFLAQENGQRAVYAKRHLVPFGEYVPFGFRWFVDALGIPMVDQRRGKVPSQPLIVAGTRIALGVCYENLFAGELRDWFQDGTPDLIVFCANLGWFSLEATHQFTQVSAMRAKEASRPVLQVVNNAMSAAIGVTGAIERQAGVGAQNLDTVVRVAKGETTPFMRMGFASLGLFILGLFATVFLFGALLRWIFSKKSIPNR